MNATSRSGLTLVELIVVVAVLFVAASVLTPCISNAPLQANMTAVGTRGRDVYVAVTGANTEREALGLPPLWPRDFDPAADTNRTATAGVAFTNSTDYFAWLIGGQGSALFKEEPRATSLDFSKLAGADVLACPTNRSLTAENNLWTVAANVRSDMSELIPILITRNIDASSLAARMAEQDKAKVLRFDPSWETPFGNKAFVLIRKGGAIFKARPKYMSYGVVYQGQTFDTSRTPDGRVAPPLKYLTPTREVTAGEQAYAEGAAIAYQLAGGCWGTIKRVAVKSGGIGLFLTAVYLLAFFYNFKKRRRLGLQPTTSAPIIGVWVCHYFEVTFYVVGIMFGVNGDERAWAYMVAALVALALGITLALVFQRHDRETRRQQIKWLLAPFWVVLVSCFLMPAV